MVSAIEYELQSRRATASRRFNEISYTGDIVTKRGQTAKIANEMYWYENVPSSIRAYCPDYLGRQSPDTYRVAYVRGCSLSEYALGGYDAACLWEIAYFKCFAFIGACREYGPLAADHGDALYTLVAEKSRRRLVAFDEALPIDAARHVYLNGVCLPSLREMLSVCTGYLTPTSRAWLGVMHGDFCFSNILLERAGGTLKTIDPRGSIDDVAPSIFGDVRYDLAKLLQCGVGYYDFIVAEYLRARVDGINSYALDVGPALARSAMTKGLLRRLADMEGVSIEETLAVAVHLFVSMVPLHYESKTRQITFVANAYRLYGMLVSGRKAL